MNPKLLAFIRTLSEKDTKTLSQKTLKCGEEFGELARKTLPFENAHATNHRFVERRDILEECVDVMLAALSIAYDLKFSDQEVEEMMREKSEKWAGLQAREAGVNFPLPYEIHVTVSKAIPIEFTEACEGLGVKPIFLALQDRHGQTVLDDVMTSSVFFGNNRQALEELDRITQGLKDEGLNVVRRKIETVPWHPAAPSEQNGVSVMPAGGYFESHLNVIVQGDDEVSRGKREELLKSIAGAHKAHLSRNVFKKLSENAYTLMLTLRHYEGTRERFNACRDQLHEALTQAGFQVEKVITEFSLFDSSRTHDASWLASA